MIEIPFEEFVSSTSCVVLAKDQFVVMLPWSTLRKINTSTNCSIVLEFAGGAAPTPIELKLVFQHQEERLHALWELAHHGRCNVHGGRDRHVDRVIMEALK